MEFFYGLDLGNPNKEERLDVFNDSKPLEKFLTHHGCKLIPVYTNVRQIEPRGSFYATRQFAALLGGVAHALSGSFGNCLMALDHRVDYYCEWGSHPWLNKYYTSSGLNLYQRWMHIPG